MIQVWKIPVSLPNVLLSLPLTGETLDEISKQIPDGAYTTFRTFQRYKVLGLSSHLARIEETARLAGYPIQMTWNHYRSRMREVIDTFPTEGELRLRLTLDISETVGDIYICVEPLHVPTEQNYQDGVSVVLKHLHRENPKAKLTRWIEISREVRENIPAGVHEAIMVGENDELLEGLSSNFFAVRNGELWTCEEGVLMGITRKFVLDEARKVGIQAHLQGVSVNDLDGLAEAFITSTSRGVLPVVRIGETVIGNGHPGEITHCLQLLYERRVVDELEEI